MVGGFMGSEAGSDGDGGDDKVDEDEEGSGSDPCGEGSQHAEVGTVEQRV